MMKTAPIALPTATAVKAVLDCAPLVGDIAVVVGGGGAPLGEDDGESVLEAGLRKVLGELAPE